MSSYNDIDDINNGVLSDAAMASLQLSHQPFISQQKAGVWFVDDTVQSQLEDIKHALISGDDLLLILGPDGAGKTTLLSQLGDNSGHRIQCFAVSGSNRFSTYNLFAGMLAAFHKPTPDDLKLLLDELIPCLQGMMSQNTLGAIVLDDAQNIPESELTKLLSGMLYINSADETLVRVCLAGPTEFEERIAHLLPEGADMPYSTLAMEAFDKVRSKSYLEHRLSQAGALDASPFSDREIAKINQAAGGRPGALHTIAAEELNMRDPNYVAALPPELQTKTRKAGMLAGIPGTKLLLGALALCMIVAGLFFFKPKSEDTVADNRYKVQETRKIVPGSNAAVDDNSSQAGNSSGNSTGETDAAVTSSQSDSARNTDGNLGDSSDGSNVADTSNGNGNETVNTANNNTGADSNNATATNAASNNVSAANSASAGAGADNQAISNAAETDNAAAEAAAAEAQAEADRLAQEKAAKEAEEKAAEAAAEKAAEQAIADARARQEAEARAAAEAEEAAAKAAADAEAEALSARIGKLESPNWILVQDPSLFTVQMIASTDSESVERFMARNNLEAPNSIFSFDRNGTIWHALVHGLYPTISAARAEIETMPESARNNQPWIRAVGRIQQSLKEQSQ